MRVVQYQGGLMTDRGIEQGIEAIEYVPDAVFTIIGFGPDKAGFEALGQGLAPSRPDPLLEPCRRTSCSTGPRRPT